MVMTRAGKAEIVELFARHISSGQVRYLRAGRLDLLEGIRQGVTFTDPAEGRQMIDCFSSAGSFNVGRGNPEVVGALLAALTELDMGTPGLDSPWKAALRQRLAELAPGDLDHVILLGGGGEALDCAIKLARGATGRPEILSTVKAYHGHTGLALSANGKAHYRDYCEPLAPAFRFVPFNDLQAARRQVGRNTAAVLVEPIQGEAGIQVAAPGYLEGLRQLCDESGALLIFDEVQTGFGRTGALFAAQRDGVVPDLMAVAKSLGGGLYPCAALLCRPRPEVASFLELHPGFHTTSGGGNLAAAVSLATIDFIVREDLAANARRQGERLRTALEALRRRHPGIIREVRGAGLMVGVEYVHEFLGPMMSEALARQSLFAAYSGNAPQVMRFMVPLTVNDEELGRVIGAIEAAVDDLGRLLPLALLAARNRWLLRLLNSERVQTALFGTLRRVEELIGRSPSRSPAAAAPMPAPAKSQRVLATVTPKSAKGGRWEAGSDGAFLKLSNGRQAIDCISVEGAAILGRRPAELVAALRAAAQTADQGNFPMVSEAKARLAGELVRFMPGEMAAALYAVGHGEAIDAACKVARGVTNRGPLLTFEGGWFGETGFAMTLSRRRDQALFGPLIPGVRLFPFGELGELAKELAKGAAAVVVEPVQVENHCRELPPPVLRELARLCRRHRALLVVDEGQSGFGRCGRPFEYERAGIAPDMVVVGEALGGGIFPIAATVVNGRVKRFLDRHPMIHLSTFGGSDVGCQVAQSALKAYGRERPWEKAERTGAKLREELATVAAAHPGVVVGVAGRGLVVSLLAASEEQAGRLVAELARAGVMARRGRVEGRSVLLRPSLLIDQEVTAKLVRSVAMAVAKLSP